MKRVLAELDARGLSYVVLCPTHCSARIHKDARTVASFVHKMFARGRVPRVKLQYIVIDEAYNVSTLHWTALAQLFLANESL